MSVRVIAGTHKNRVLRVPAGLATRPTGEPPEQLQVVSQVSELGSGLEQGGGVTLYAL